MHFMAVEKSIKFSVVVVYSYFKGQCIDSNLQGYKYLQKVCERDTICQ